VNLAILSLALVCGDGGSSSAAYAFAPLDDRAELERSEWRVVGLNSDGKDSSKWIDAQVRWVFKDGTLGVRNPDATAPGNRRTVKLNPTSKPKQIDLEEIDGGKALGIYCLKNDTLTLAIGRNKERPNDLSPAANVNLFILKRVKP
jgi:uncharacterized protein (TIGR03067 family)